MSTTAQDFSRQKLLGAQLSIITGFQILGSFAMQWYVVTLLGAGSSTDALYTGAVFPQVLTITLVESLTSVLIPLLAAMADREAEESAWLLLTTVFLIFGSVSAVLFVSVRLMVPLLVPGFTPATRELTASLARIQVLGLVFGACTAPMSALCQVRHRFRLPALASLLGLVVGCAMLLLGLKRFGIELAAWAQVVATGIPTLLLFPSMGRIRSAAWNREVMRTIYSRIRPLTLSKAFYMVSIPLDRFLASFLAPGSIVILELANRFYTAVLRVLSQGILTPFLPVLSRYAHEKRWRDYRYVNRRQVVFMAVPTLLVVLVVAVACFFVSGWAQTHHTVHVAGNLTGDNVALIFLIMGYMAGLLPAVAISNALTSAFFAQGDTRTPTRIGVQMFVFGFALKIAGFYLGGIKGIAIAVTIWAVMQTAIMAVVLDRRTRRLIEGDDEPELTEPGMSAIEVEERAVS